MSVTARLATGLIPLIALVALATAFVAPSETPIGEASGHELVLTEVPQNWRAPEELLAPFGAGETVTRILVHVTPTAGVDSFAGWDDSSALSAHQDRVAALVDAVLADLPDGEFATLRRFDNQAGFAGLATRLGLDLLTEDPRVQTIEPDSVIEMHTKQGIPLIKADVVNDTYDGTGVSVAICDTGIDYTHEDLGGGGFPNAKVLGGYDFGDDDSDPFDFQGHGTSCAGIAAGDINEQGDYVGGVAPNARLYALKMSHGSGGSAFLSNMIASFDWCVTHKNDDPANPILVINCSFGGARYYSACDGSETGYATSINNLTSAGIAFFASSGNDAYCDSMARPACIGNAISVGAVYDDGVGGWIWCANSDSCVASSCNCCSGWTCTDNPTVADDVNCYSNSADFLDVLAPSWIARSPATGGGYRDFSGTSAAAPYASGAAAVLQSAQFASFGSYLPATDLRDLMTETGDPVVDAKSGIETPRLNVENAVAALVPLNDDCSSAIDAVDGSQPFSNIGATTDGPAEPGSCEKGGESQIGSDVWFRYTAPCAGNVTVSTCGADYDSKIAVYAGDCPTGAGAIACGDDECGSAAEATFTAEQFDVFLIRVGGHDAAEGVGDLTIECVPANDDCANALAVSAGDTVFSSENATTDGPDESGTCGGASVENDVWFAYTASCNGEVTASLCGSSYDTMLAVYEGADCPTSATAIACDDEACGNNRSEVTFAAAAGTVYLLRVGGFEGATGTGVLSLDCATPFDDCSNPGALADGTTPFETIGAATDGPDEPGGCSKSGYTQIGADVWYVYTAACTGTVTVGACGADFDTKLAVYAGDGCPSSGEALACGDDECGTASEVTFVAMTGSEYLVRVGGHDEASGTGSLTVSCDPFVLDECQGIDGVDKLRVNFDNGLSSEHVVTVDAEGPIFMDMALPDAGGNGKFFVHMNVGAPSESTRIELGAGLGPMCHPILTSQGATPVAVWNALGKPERIGTSSYFGGAIADPGRAPEQFVVLASGDPVNLPVGSSFTLQGIILNPTATSPKGASVTNALLMVVE